MRRKLRIRVKPYRKKGKRIRGHVKYVPDKGKLGRGQKIIRIKRPGSLGKGFFKKSEAEQKRVLGIIAKKKGQRVAAGKMRAVQVLSKRTNPKISRRAKKLSSWVYKNY